VRVGETARHDRAIVPGKGKLCASVPLSAKSRINTALTTTAGPADHRPRGPRSRTVPSASNGAIDQACGLASAASAIAAHAAAG
jgi:hypothetical protein